MLLPSASAALPERALECGCMNRVPHHHHQRHHWPHSRRHTEQKMVSDEVGGRIDGSIVQRHWQTQEQRVSPHLHPHPHPHHRQAIPIPMQMCWLAGWTAGWLASGHSTSARMDSNPYPRTNAGWMAVLFLSFFPSFASLLAHAAQPNQSHRLARSHTHSHAHSRENGSRPRAGLAGAKRGWPTLMCE